MSGYISAYISSFTKMSSYVNAYFFVCLCNRICNHLDLLPAYVSADVITFKFLAEMQYNLHFQFHR